MNTDYRDWVLFYMLLGAGVRGLPLWDQGDVGVYSVADDWSLR